MNFGSLWFRINFLARA